MLCLTRATDRSWASAAARDLDRVLVDHAHCEMKAASNAISLATRWPATTEVARKLSAIADEELAHFRSVLAELDARGVALGAPAVDEYAARLRKLATISSEKTPAGSLADRLLVGALIEARSCERFRLLSDALAPREPRLASFYDELFAAEARHYTTFVDLAIEVRGDEELVRARLARLAEAEGALAEQFGTTATIHG